MPVMPATVLSLEMLLLEPQIDLGRAAEIILNDVGATIQILHMIDAGNYTDEDRPRRMVDCLASLDSSAWFNALAARTFACDPEDSETTALWRHCRLLGQCAQFVSEWFEYVSPEEAYLVGLLHDSGVIAGALGWSGEGTEFLPAEEIKPPLFMFSATTSAGDGNPTPDWRFILTAARELASTCWAYPDL